MSAPLGNQFWKARSSHGRKPIFPNPDALWTACVEYFEWVEANPLWEDSVTTYQGVVKHEPIRKMRAMTIGGLCIFLDISQQAWSEYKQRDGYGEVATRADQVIRAQKFEGAAADLLNANIIARDLGLADKADHTVGNPDGSSLQERSPREIAMAVLAAVRAAQADPDAG